MDGGREMEGAGEEAERPYRTGGTGDARVEGGSGSGSERVEERHLAKATPT